MTKYDNPFEQALTGLEIKDWVWYHSNHSTSYTKVATKLGKVFNLDDNKYYMLKLCNNVPKIIETQEHGIKYDIPCEGEE